MTGITILDNNFEQLKIFDIYSSLIWCKRYNTVGAIDLEIDANIENINLFKKNNYIVRDDDNSIYRIEAVEINTDDEGNNSLIIGANAVLILLKQRMIWNNFSYTSTAENFIKKLLNDNFVSPEDTDRRVSNLKLNIPVLTTEETNRTTDYENVGDKIFEICAENNLGCKIEFNRQSKELIFSLYKGADRTIYQTKNNQILFSPEYDNLFSSKYNLDISELKNVALISGDDGTLNSYGNETGIDRREMYIDSSIKNDTGSTVKYNQALVSKAREEIAKTTNTVSFEGEVDIDIYKYKEDYELGDLVTIKNEFGIITNVRITEIIETWDDTGYTIEPKFEYFESIEALTITMALLTESNEPMITENNEAILYENKSFITEDRKKYITTESGLLIDMEA